VNRTRALAASTSALLLVSASACRGDGPLTIDLVIPDTVAAAAAVYQLNLFTAADCATLELQPGEPDLVRTSTPSLRRNVRQPADIGTLGQDQLVDGGAVHIRAIDSDGIPLAERCLDASPLLAGVRLELGQLAPTGAVLSSTTPFALRSGSARSDLLAQVRDATGMRVPGLFVSIGAAYPVARTATSGDAFVPTPTTAAGLDSALSVQVYGIPHQTLTGRATVLAPPACPTPAWTSDPLFDAALPSARVELASAGALVFVSRPDGGPTGRALDDFREVSGRKAYERVATTTVAGGANGPLAAALDMRDQRFVVVEGMDGAAIAVVRYDPTARSFGGRATLRLSGASSGGSDPIDAVVLGRPDPTEAGLELFASASARSPAIQRFSGNGAITSTGTMTSSSGFAAPVGALPAAESGDAAVALALQAVGPDRAPDLVYTTHGRLVIYRGLGDGSFSPTPSALDGVSGRIAIGPLSPLLGPAADIALADTARPTPHSDNPLYVATATGSAPTLSFSGASGPGAQALLISEVNGDGHPDLVVLDTDDGTLALVLGDGRGHFLRAAACRLTDSPSRMIPALLEGDQEPEALVVLDGARALALVPLAP
jgi:hypothetical protein